MRTTDRINSAIRRLPIKATLIVFFLSLYLLTTSGRIDSGDGETIYQTTRSMVENLSFAIPPPPPASPDTTSRSAPESRVR